MEKLKVAIVGLGRLGKNYAINLHRHVPNAQLVAAASVVPAELHWVDANLAGVRTFSQYEEMLRAQTAQLIFVLSSSNLHVEHMSMALDAGMHVFSEKPLATSSQACSHFEQVAQQFPGQMAAVGFVRRFDASYQYAKAKVEAGAIGRPFMVRSQTVDVSATAGFQSSFVSSSGGIFHDFNVHDIDLARWFLQSDVRSVYSVGGSFKFPGFAEAGDADNVVSTCTFDNGAMAIIGASRTGSHAHDTYTEITGTEGTLLVGRPAAKNRVEIYDRHGARREGVETFWHRFKDAFLTMTQHVVDKVQQGARPDLQLSDATAATRVAEAFTESFKSGQLVHLKSQ